MSTYSYILHFEFEYLDNNNILDTPPPKENTNEESITSFITEGNFNYI